MSRTSPSREKTERLINLILCLKSARRPVSKQRIRASITDYANAASDEAFERMFERDKDDLRTMGIPVRAAVMDPLWDDEFGYRIDSDETALPAIAFEADEVMALGLAARAWSGASLAGSAAGALRKLALAGVEVDEQSLESVQPVIRTKEPAFDAVHAALLARQPVTFAYRRPDGATSQRHVRPWALKFTRGRWYLTGFDVDRDDQRAFRLSRVEGKVTPKGRAGSYEVPADHRPQVLVGAHDTEPEGDAVVRVAPGAGHALRRRAIASLETADGWSELTIPYEPGNTVREVLSLGERAVALSPGELVDAVVAALQGGGRG